KKLGLADKIRFYNIAAGPIEVCKYYLILTRDLKYGEVKGLTYKAERISRMLHAYMLGIRKVK
ncbi:MAG: four helix bundle protein, partial [Acidobacteriota bacterium]